MSTQSESFILGYAVAAMEIVQSHLIQNESSIALSKINEALINVNKKINFLYGKENIEAAIDKRNDN